MGVAIPQAENIAGLFCGTLGPAKSRNVTFDHLTFAAKAELDLHITL